MKSLCRIGQCFAMCDVLCRHGSNGGRKVAKDFCEQFVAAARALIRAGHAIKKSVGNLSR